MKDEYIDVDDVPGRASKIDKWKYNDILNDIARNAWYSLGTPLFSYWAKRFVKALGVINLKNLPLKTMLKNKDAELRNLLYYNRAEQLKKNCEIWGDPYKRDSFLNKWEEEYWEELFDYALELATKAGFTFHIDSIDESVALR